MSHCGLQSKSLRWSRSTYKIVVGLAALCSDVYCRSVRPVENPHLQEADQQDGGAFVAVAVAAGSPLNPLTTFTSLLFALNARVPASSSSNARMAKLKSFEEQQQRRDAQKRANIDMRLDFGQVVEEEVWEDSALANADDVPLVPASAPSISSRLGEVERLARWVQEAGGSIDSVVAEATANKGLGLRTTKPVRNGDVVLSVPLSLGLSAKSCLESPIGSYLEEFYPDLADYAFIALALIHERRLGSDSKLAPWLSGSPSLLPTSFPDLPLVWGQSAQAEVNAGTTAGIAKRMQSIQADFAWLQENVFEYAPLVFPPFVFSLDAYTQAMAIAISRAIPVPVADDVQPILLPFFDLVNHDLSYPTARIGWKEGKAKSIFNAEAPESATLVVKSGDLAEGKSVTICYGGQTSGELFVDQGFLEEPVPLAVTVTFAIADDDPNYDEKADTLEAAGLPIEGTWLVAGDQGDEIPNDLIAFLRLKHLSGEDAFLLEAVLRDSLWYEHVQFPVSRENEQAALTDIWQTVSRYSAQLGGSVKSDIQSLSEAAKDSNEYAMASIRYAERRVLQHLAVEIEKKLSSLDGLQYYQERRLASLGLNPVETEEEIKALRSPESKMAASAKYEW